MVYQSPFGHIEGLRDRLAEMVRRAKLPTGNPFIGLGRVADMELVVQLLSLREFGEYLRTHSDDALQRWGAEVVEASEAADELSELGYTIAERLPEVANDSHEARVTVAGETIDDIRALLVDVGALTEGDTSTPIAGLVRALLS